MQVDLMFLHDAGISGHALKTWLYMAVDFPEGWKFDDLAKHLNSRGAASRHLSELRECGLVARTSNGWICNLGRA